MSKDPLEKWRKGVERDEENMLPCPHQRTITGNYLWRLAGLNHMQGPNLLIYIQK